MIFKNNILEKAIVCVDDEKSILSGLEQQLRREFSDGFYLEFAQSGDEAISLVKDLRESNIEIPILITDQMMPGMKGSELIEQLESICPETKCVMLTGYADSEDMRSLKSRNLLKCFNKPWDNKDFIEFIKVSLVSNQ